MNNPLHAARSYVWLGDLPCSHRSFMDREEIQSSKKAPVVEIEEGLLCFLFFFSFSRCRLVPISQGIQVNLLDMHT